MRILTIVALLAGLVVANECTEVSKHNLNAVEAQKRILVACQNTVDLLWFRITNAMIDTIKIDMSAIPTENCTNDLIDRHLKIGLNYLETSKEITRSVVVAYKCPGDVVIAAAKSGK